MQTNVTAVRVAGEVRAAMARRGVSQTALAAALGMSQAAVSRRLRADVPLDVKELAAIAEILGVPLSALLADTGEVVNSVAS